tara:strand:- start:98 stop:262 length:165 start_codon:yes stop_codon:yes gene_type:complete
VEKEAKKPEARRWEEEIALVLILKYLLMRKKSKAVSLRMVRGRLKRKRVWIVTN